MGLDSKKYPDVFRTFLTKYLDTSTPGTDLGLDEKQRNISRFKNDNEKVRILNLARSLIPCYISSWVRTI